MILAKIGDDRKERSTIIPMNTPKFSFTNILHILSIALSATAIGFSIFGNKGALPGELQNLGGLVNTVGTAVNPAGTAS